MQGEAEFAPVGIPVEPCCGRTVFTPGYVAAGMFAAVRFATGCLRSAGPQPASLQPAACAVVRFATGNFASANFVTGRLAVSGMRGNRAAVEQAAERLCEPPAFLSLSRFLS